MTDEFSDPFIKTLGHMVGLDIPRNSLENVRKNLILLNQYSQLIQPFSTSKTMKETQP